MKLQIGDSRVGISGESLVLFLVFTAIGTVLGGIAYNYLLPYLPPALGGPAKGTTTPTGAANPLGMLPRPPLRLMR
jgi:hypothetical protein